MKGDRRTGTASDVTKSGGGPVFDKPADNIGTKTIPDYAGYAAKHTYNINIKCICFILVSCNSSSW